MMPYYWHRARKFSLFSALNANPILCSIGSLFFQGIALECYLCPEPVPADFSLRNVRSSFSRELSDGFWRFKRRQPGGVLSSHRASGLPGQSPLPLPALSMLSQTRLAPCSACQKTGTCLALRGVRPRKECSEY